jgi:hypothetical protein
MTFVNEKGEQVCRGAGTHGSADDRRVEAGGIGASSGGCGSGSRFIEAHDLWLEGQGQVRWHGCKPGAGSQAVAGEEHATAEVGSGSEPGQESAAVGDSKKRQQFIALKTAIGQMPQEYAFSERRACGLVTLAAFTYRYRRGVRTNRCARNWWSWRTRSHASGIAACSNVDQQHT